MGQIVRPYSCCISSQEKTISASISIWRLVSKWKENNFSIYCYCLFVLVLLQMATRFGR